VADKFRRFLHDRRQFFVGRFYWQTKLANFIVRLTSALGRASQWNAHICVTQLQHFFVTHFLETIQDADRMGINQPAQSTHMKSLDFQPAETYSAEWSWLILMQYQCWYLCKDLVERLQDELHKAALRCTRRSLLCEPPATTHTDTIGWQRTQHSTQLPVIVKTICLSAARQNKRQLRWQRMGYAQT